MGIFKFSLVQQLDIRALHFSQCGNTIYNSSAILVFNTEVFQLETCILKSSPLVALHLESISNCSLLNNTFVGNKAINLGGAINIYSSTVMFTNNSFIYNEENLDYLLELGLGAIYTQDSSLTFSATTVFFKNSANTGSGGALQANNTMIVLSGNIQYVNNAAVYGGAVSVQSCVLYFNGNVHFEGNQAIEYGGAIYVPLKLFLTSFTSIQIQR